MCIQPFIDKALLIDGWMSPKELTWLGNIARNARVIIEFGSFKGRSTRALADNTNGIVIAVDPWDGIYFDSRDKKVDYITADAYDHFQSNLSDHLDNRVIPVHRKSIDFNSPFQADLIFIDADHRYEEVKKDISHSLNFLAYGATLAGHDYGRSDWPGVKQAVDELLSPIETCDTIWFKKF